MNGRGALTCPTRRGWRSRRTEPILEPDLPIVDPHHHLWDRANHRYLLDELLADTGTGHNVIATVFIDCRSMYRADGPAEMRPVGETEFANGVAAMSASGLYGPTRACAGIVGYADLTLGERARAVLEAHVARRRRPLPRHPPRRRLGSPAPTCATATPTRRRASTARPTSARASPQLGALGLTFEAWQYHPQLKEVTALARAVPQHHR